MFTTFLAVSFYLPIGLGTVVNIYIIDTTVVWKLDIAALFEVGGIPWFFISILTHFDW